MQARDQFIVTTVREAGEMLRLLMSKQLSISSKDGDDRNIVTSADIEINNFIINKIKAVFPGESVYSEETTNNSVGDSFWSIDPIDGTSNFARNIPHFAITVTFLDQNVPLVGAVYNPITQELFNFKKGEGVFLNEKKVSVSLVKDIKKAYTILHIGRRENVREWGINLQRKLLASAKKTINLASSALDLCFLASGRVDAVIYGTMTTLDAASAIGMVREAGGEVYDVLGNPVKFIDEPQVIIATSTKALFDEISIVMRV